MLAEQPHNRNISDIVKERFDNTDICTLDMLVCAKIAHTGNGYSSAFVSQNAGQKHAAKTTNKDIVVVHVATTVC